MQDFPPHCCHGLILNDMIHFQVRYCSYEGSAIYYLHVPTYRYLQKLIELAFVGIPLQLLDDRSVEQIELKHIWTAEKLSNCRRCQLLELLQILSRCFLASMNHEFRLAGQQPT